MNITSILAPAYTLPQFQLRVLLIENFVFLSRPSINTGIDKSHTLY